MKSAFFKIRNVSKTSYPYLWTTVLGIDDKNNNELKYGTKREEKKLNALKKKKKNNDKRLD